MELESDILYSKEQIKRVATSACSVDRQIVFSEEGEKE